jgi:hypothetical protein
VFAFKADYQEAFKGLKRHLITLLVLIIYNLELENILETNALDLVIATILTQKGVDSKRRVVIYYLRKIIELEKNYNVHDKELLAIIEVFRT